MTNLHQEPAPEFPNVQHGCLPVGTWTSLGEITNVSLTAYEVTRCEERRFSDGDSVAVIRTWVAFEKLHGPRTPATPLVTFDGDPFAGLP